MMAASIGQLIYDVAVGVAVAVFAAMALLAVMVWASRRLWG